MHRRESFTSTFVTEARGELAALGQNARQVLIYLHGDDVLFEEAALRSAQIGFDLHVPGPTVFFSWPTYSRVSGYLSDNDRIAISENQIVNFLTDVARVTPPKYIHIIAHSMGNRGLARALQSIVADASVRSDLQFGHLILAAPDLIELSTQFWPASR